MPPCTHGNDCRRATVVHDAIVVCAQIGVRSIAAVYECLAICPKWCLWWAPTRLEVSEAGPLIVLSKPRMQDADATTDGAHRLHHAKLEFPFIPDLILKIIMYMYPHIDDMHNVLSVDWVRTWEGWKDTQAALDSSADDNECETVAQDCAQRFSRLVLQKKQRCGCSFRCTAKT